MQNIVRLFQYRELLRNLIYKEMKVTYCASLFGLFWSMLIPFANMVIFWVVFGIIFKSNLKDFVIYLISGILPWNLFSSAITNSTHTIISNGKLIKKIYFPRTILPAANIGFQLVLFGMALIVFFGFNLVIRKHISVSFLAYPVVTLLFLFFTLGVAFVVSSLTTFYRDIRQVVEIGLAVLFWMTPIVYDFETLSPKMKLIVSLNPITHFIKVFHDIAYWENFSQATDWLLCIILAGTIFGLGLFIFKSLEYRFVEEL